MAHRVERTILGGLLGAVPGAVVLGLNAAAVSGEAGLLVGVTGIFLLLLGVPIGAVLGFRRAGMRGTALVGAALGALPGVVLTPSDVIDGRRGISLLILVAGAAIGASLWGRRRRVAPPGG